MTNHPFCYHTAVTLLSHHSSYTTTPPHSAKFAVTLLSHYCHTTITKAIPSQKINSPKKDLAHILPKLLCFSEKVPHFLENVRHFPEKVPCFPEKVGHYRRGCSPSLLSPVTDVTEKKHKTLGICARTYALTRVKSFTPKDKTSLLSDSFPKLVIARPATPKEKVKYFTFPSFFFGGGVYQAI